MTSGSALKSTFFHAAGSLLVDAVALVDAAGLSLVDAAGALLVNAVEGASFLAVCWTVPFQSFPVALFFLLSSSSPFLCYSRFLLSSEIFPVLAAEGAVMFPFSSMFRASWGQSFNLLALLTTFLIRFPK